MPSKPLDIQTAAGYAYDLIMAPGEKLDLMLSTEAPRVDVDFVRLLHPDDSFVGGTGPQEQLVESWPALCEVPGGVQVAQAGSSGTVAGIDVPALEEALFLDVWVWSQLPSFERDQTILQLSVDDESLTLGLDAAGHAYLQSGELGRITLEHPLPDRSWTRLTAELSRHRPAELRQQTRERQPYGEQQARQTAAYDLDRVAGGIGQLHIAATDGTADHFSGRIDNPRVLSGSDLGSATPLVDVDFAENIAGSTFADRAHDGRVGTLANMPTRGVSGYRYDGSEVDYRLAPELFSAIHFHEDDIVDLNWRASATTHVPTDLASGFYAARVHADGEVIDRIPFIVRTARGQRTAPIVLLAPTVTYVAYANSRLSVRVNFAEMGLSTKQNPVHPLDLGLKEHPEWGSSTYDVHTDGSPVCYAGWRRPISGLRPHHYMRQTGAPRHLSADLYLTHWLDHTGLDYDVVSDHDLHVDGASALDGTQVLILASHPEYWTAEMLDALVEFQAGGGSVMYLGGNGLYWVTSVAPSDGSVVEVRRAHSGVRSWEALAGEATHSTTGEVGGLWRHRDRAPQRYVGVGMSAQGWGGQTPGFQLLEDADSARVDFAFEGVARTGTIGRYGIGYGGAAGDEIDRLDVNLGTPRHALRLGTSQGAHSEHYQLVPEDIPVTVPALDGTNNDLVRADLVFYETGFGGAVFSVGSISYCTALSHQDYDNDIARLTTNMLTRMADEKPFTLPETRD